MQPDIKTVAITAFRDACLEAGKPFSVPKKADFCQDAVKVLRALSKDLGDGVEAIGRRAPDLAIWPIEQPGGLGVWICNPDTVAGACVPVKPEIALVKDGQHITVSTSVGSETFRGTDTAIRLLARWAAWHLV